MKTIIEKYVNDGQNSGLYLLPFPTGIGKSYQVVQFILDGLKKGTDNRRIFFLTSNRNNLPRTDLQVALGEEYSKFILEVRSFEDCIIENFEVSIIHSEFADDEVIQALKSAKDAYERAKERYEDESNKMLFVRNEPEIVKMKREEFLEAENNFRRYIRNHVVYELRDSLSKEGLNDEELQAQVVWHLKNNKKYQWIGKIYPNIFARDYKVIMMSMKKFLTINDCFFEPKYTFAKGDISSNSLIFIDEFDQTKDVLTDTIIEESLKNANDYLRLVETICYKVINYEQQLPHKVLRVIDENKRTFQRLYDEASEVFSKYKVYLKYYCHEAKGRNFLFNDFSYHSVFSTQGEKYAYVYENKENNNMTITLSKKSIEENSDKTDTDFDEFIQERELKDNMENPISGKEEVEVYSIYSVIRAFNHLLLSFKWFVQNIVPSYQEIDKAFKEKYKGASDIVDLLTDEHAVMSLYNCFGLSETVLKHPTASKKLYEKDEAMREYYICSKKQMNKYYFVEYHDFANVNVFFVDTKEDVLNSMKKQNNLRIDTYIKECSQENARLEELFQCEGVKEFFVEQGYATKFKKNDYMMCPILFQNIYKGALGEVVGKFILERELRTTLKELDTTIFEKFDFELCKDVYIDFKHWRRSSIRKTDYLNKIHRKLLSVNGKRAYIINLLDESNGKDCISKTFDGKIVEIPFLIHANDHTVNHEVIEMLMEELVNG